MPVNTDHAIELRAVDKRYGKTVVVDGIDLQVHNGECFVLIGHNGAGKTTIMKLMLGLTRPSIGQVMVLGEDPMNRSFVARRQAMGYLPESASFYPHMTGLELLGYYARLKGVSSTEIGRRLEQVGLLDAATRRLNTYSKGMRQRLGLAQAVLGAPRLLFLDEPTTGLDPLVRRDFYQIISDLRSGGTTVVISSHALNEIEVRADRIAVIKHGRLVACGSLSDLSRRVGLPVRTRLAVASGSAARVAGQLAAHTRIDRVNDHSVDLICPEDEKMAMLRHIADLGDTVLDVSMTTPRLDEIYLHFMNGERA
ncbi:MAG: ABC transporter ATP-binding protein [Gammaproteobacteria bacterium]|nr:ABC transporter ATP-binding protein [Gammaproteobacteria bacterium]